jgi:hypothetical protein
MSSSTPDLTPAILAVTVALAFIIIGSRLLSWYRLRALRLCMLTGTHVQRAALRVRLAPVVREFLPLLDHAGLQVRAIVLLPTLTGTDGDSVVAEVEQLSGSGAYIIRLAHRLGGTVRQPDDVAGVLADNLLYLYRHAAAVTVVRQTPAGPGLDTATHSAPLKKPAGRNGLATLPRPAGQNEAEETILPFKASPLGPRNGQSS